MNDRFESTVEDILTANKKGEVRNLLITDGNTEFLNDALCTLRNWADKNGINIVEIDENDKTWLSEIVSRKLYIKLNHPNTVLLIKNYASVNFHRNDKDASRKFLRDVVMNRRYRYGEDFVLSD